MTDHLESLDVVALTVDLPSDHHAPGQVGPIVEVLDDGVFEVEFSDDEGRAYAFVTVRGEHLLPLRYEPSAAD